MDKSSKVQSICEGQYRGHCRLHAIFNIGLIETKEKRRMRQVPRHGQSKGKKDQLGDIVKTQPGVIENKLEQTQLSILYPNEFDGLIGLSVHSGIMQRRAKSKQAGCDVLIGYSTSALVSCGKSSHQKNMQRFCM